VLSGGYEDDRDEGEWFLYTGSGGRDLSGNKRTNKVRRPRLAMQPRPARTAACRLAHTPFATLAGPASRCPALPPARPRDLDSPPQEQSFDQEFTLMNEALRQSCIKGLPVRVVRRCARRGLRRARGLARSRGHSRSPPAAALSSPRPSQPSPS
jgi:hypothetical protein